MTSNFLAVRYWLPVHFVGLQHHCFVMEKAYMPDVIQNNAW